MSKVEKKEASPPAAIERAKAQTNASMSAALDARPQGAIPATQEKAPASSTSQATSTKTDTTPSRQMSQLSMSGKMGTPDTSTSTSEPSQAPVAATKVEDVKKTTPIAKPSNNLIPASSAPVASDTPSSSTPSAKKPSQTHWSRAFLAGKTHLKPEYEDVHNISSVTSASVQLLKANTKYFFYPLSGPGGRLAYHPISAKGRLPVQTPCIGSGHDIVDFALDPFGEDRVFIAGSDGRIRVFEVTQGKGNEVTTPFATLEGRPTLALMLLICIKQEADVISEQTRWTK